MMPLGKPRRIRVKEESIVMAAKSETVSYQIDTPTFFDTRELRVYSISPVTEEHIWVGKHINLAKYDYKGNMLMEAKTKVRVRGLSYDANKNILYASFVDSTICTVDLENGATKNLFKCAFDPYCIAATNDGHLVIAEYWISDGYLRKMTLDGQEVLKSKEKYQIYDVAYNNDTNQAVISCCEDGIKILNDKFDQVLAEFKLGCSDTAVYFGNYIIMGDKKEIHVLSSNDLSVVSKFDLEDMTHPLKIRVFKNSLWLECVNRHRIIRAMFNLSASILYTR